MASARDACAQQAQQAAEGASTANYKAALDLQTAQTQAEMDAQVYGVGHGHRETRDFLSSRLQQASDASVAESQRIADKLSSDKQAVAACVTQAQMQGKADYSAFKADKRHKRAMPEAESLMTAWLTNLGEIDTGHPQGSDASLAAWRSAKTHTELSAL
ncbi:hypothetical protein EAH75_04390 [Rhodanobacter glycinis]|nr:hypothetical protein EAH75_04390 [Rhodanobacter glycinis]